MTVKSSIDQLVADNLQRIREQMANACIAAGRNPDEVTLLAVTKTVDAERINAAIRHGADHIGENRVQEFLSKRDELHLNNVQAHLIGHLQTNKIKYMAPYVSLIHGVDSYKLLAEINKQAIKAGRVIPCLLQIHN